ncbi:MAG: hypothetical protein JJE17_11745 [Peptostreptococcaceae bacterium]|nr:hypothetical protein [Peptostreptococcaceae bacterium]
MSQMDLTNKFKSVLKKLSKNDPELFAEVHERMKLLEDGYTEQLTIKPINRENGKYKIQEIVINYPSSFRVFYIQVKMDGDNILLVDGQRKKVRKFKPNYFKQLDKCIKEHLND